jgi:DNA-binding transcriptional MerR regulator
MLINEVCKECNLTKKAVEYYTEQGLIQPRITENGYRQFSETDALKLKRIAVLRGLGFSVPEIRTILENDSRTAIYDVLNRKELEIVELQTKQALIKQLAESGDWEQIEGQVEALQNKQSILNRILNKFPGFYGKFVCLHFAPFLSEAITTDEQREAFETIIRYLDGISIAIRSAVPGLKQRLHIAAGRAVQHIVHHCAIGHAAPEIGPLPPLFSAAATSSYRAGYSRSSPASSAQRSSTGSSCRSRTCTI